MKIKDNGNWEYSGRLGDDEWTNKKNGYVIRVIQNTNSGAKSMAYHITLTDERDPNPLVSGSAKMKNRLATYKPTRKRALNVVKYYMRRFPK